MKARVQDKINSIKKLANSSVKANDGQRKDSYDSNDSLSQVIRNEKEASIFLAELDAAIKIAQKK
jgi:hypothetical protein